MLTQVVSAPPISLHSLVVLLFDTVSTVSCLAHRVALSMHGRYNIPLAPTRWPIMIVVGPDDKVAFEDTAPACASQRTRPLSPFSERQSIAFGYPYSCSREPF
eukprot:6456716-Amphidinium_carterae.1